MELAHEVHTVIHLPNIFKVPTVCQGLRLCIRDWKCSYQKDRFLVSVYQIVTLYTLKVYNVVCQLYFSKAGKEKYNGYVTNKIELKCLSYYKKLFCLLATLCLSQLKLTDQNYVFMGNHCFLLEMYIFV